MSFRLKTILGIGFIGSFLLFILIITMLDYIEDAQNRQFLERANTTINLFTSAAREPFLASDLAKLESSIQDILVNPSIVYVKLIDSDESIVSMAGEQQALSKLFVEDTNLQQAMSDGILDISYKIKIDDFTLGTIQLGISTKSVKDDFQLIKTYALSVAGIELLLIILLSFILGTWLTRQLITLKHAAENIEKGKLGYQVNVQGNDEIALTAKTFNSMSTRLLEIENLQHKTMQKLKLAEEQSRLLLTSAGQGIFGTDTYQKISFANPEAARLLGFKSSDELINLPLNLLFNDNSLLKNIKKSLEDGHRINVNDDTLQIKNDIFINIDYTCSPIKIEDRIIGTVVTFNDISQRKEVEATIEKAHLSALDNAQTKADFMANISHELYTPLHGVIGLLQLINKDKIKDDYAEYISHAQASANHLRELIDEILDFSKITSANMQLENTDFELEGLLKECIESNYQHAFKKQLDLKLNFTPGITWLKGDPQRLKKIINNLINNAIKFTHQGSIIISVHAIEQTNQKINYEFSVKDTGIGIATDMQGKLFHTLQQIDTSTTRAFGGTGLGLATCKALIELMKGNIRVISEENKGSEFIFDATFDISSIQASLNDIDHSSDNITR